MSEFSKGELEVMQTLWEYGEMKPAEIQDRFPREIKNAALRFQLRILLDKGHVTRRKVGKAYYYKAKTPRRGAFRRMAGAMADAFTKGSTRGLIAELIQSEKLTPKEIEELKRIASTGGPKAKSKTRKGEGS